MSRYYFVKKWDENTDIERWNNDRKELNKIIDVFNNWQKEDDFDPNRIKYVLAQIEYGIQTIGSKDGGEGYLMQLKEMEQFVDNFV